jgi:two-component system chemotaxis sensor kinase CheA
MSDTRSDPSRTDTGAAAGLDLSQFHQVFYEEAGENIDNMEQMLLHIDLAEASDEDLNAIFRCAHSVKGGAATFGFADVAELTHQMETLLDRLRRHELAPTPAMVDVLLQSGDALRAMLARHQSGQGEPVDTQALLQDIRSITQPGHESRPRGSTPALMAGPGPASALASVPAPAVVAQASTQAVPDGSRRLRLTLGPLQDPSRAQDVVDLFREIGGLGTITALPQAQADDRLHRYELITTSSDDELIDLFGFHVSREEIRLEPAAPTAALTPAPAPPAVSLDAPDGSYGLFAGAPGAPEAAPHGPAAVTTTTAAAVAPPTPGAEAAAAVSARTAPARADRPPATPGSDATTLRVSVDKVDQLINLVGELVITQAMLAQTGKALDLAQHPQLASGLADLERNTRDLQEAVMSIRMIPMSVVFNRFPRMLRDLATRLGKKVELVQVGEATELDKGLVEKITDPLTHLVRNACDHGIEPPDERLARGKPEHGTLTLVASHQGGSIIIEVRDDGRGLNRGKLLSKARERGLSAPDSLSDSEVWGLIFEPGFSTAEAVTDVSGRGVGMDVVKRNITALGGTVEIESLQGHGMTVRVRLPLTLAIMDGMSVGVGAECYIMPLASVVESSQVRPQMIRTIGGASRVVEVRGEYMPVIELEEVFDVPRGDRERGTPIMVVVEAEGLRAALLVDEVLGQQQVVVKNLESNYRKVPDVSGATIMGDGRVALILDVVSLVRRSRH